MGVTIGVRKLPDWMGKGDVWFALVNLIEVKGKNGVARKFKTEEAALKAAREAAGQEVS